MVLGEPHRRGGWANDPLTKIINSAYSRIEDIEGELAVLQENVAQIPTATPNTTPQSVNQVFNGSITHSVQSWANVSPSGDAQYECQSWYSHPLADGQAMYAATSASATPNELNFTSANVTVGPPSTFTIASHGVSTGMLVKFTAASPPTGLTSGSVYYVIYVDANTIKLATTYDNALSGTNLNVTTVGSGAMVLRFITALKEDSSTIYNPGMSDWSWSGDSAGCARMSATASIDTLLPGTNIEPGYTYYGAFNIARANAYITARGEERIFSGLYAKDGSGVWDWIGSPFTITDTVVGTVATPTERRYRILASTDRGFTILSDELVVANAPSDADFAGGAGVYLTWRNVLVYGVQTYQVYRYTPGTGVYVLLAKVTTGLTSLIDNGGFVSVVAGYPTGDFDRLISYTATIPDVIDTIPFVGDPLNPVWATLPFAMQVSGAYNMGGTTLARGQWWRVGLRGLTTDRLDMDITVECTGGSAVVTCADGVFSTTDPDMTGMAYVLTDPSTKTTGTIVSVDSATQVTLSTNATASGTGYLYIAGAAPRHSLYCDLFHLDYQQGATFAPNAKDIDGTHGIPPVIPNGSPQTGTGTGQQPGTIDGQPTCLFVDVPVETSLGEIEAGDLYAIWKADNRGGKPLHLIGKDGSVRRIQNVSHALADVWYLATADGVSIIATETKRIFSPDSTLADGKIAVKDISKGTKFFIKLSSGEEKVSEVVTKELFQQNAVVVQLELEPSDDFWAGMNGKILVSNAKLPVTPG